MSNRCEKHNQVFCFCVKSRLKHPGLPPFEILKAALEEANLTCHEPMPDSATINKESSPKKATLEEANLAGHEPTIHKKSSPKKEIFGYRILHTTPFPKRELFYYTLLAERVSVIEIFANQQGHMVFTAEGAAVQQFIETVQYLCLPCAKNYEIRHLIRGQFFVSRKHFEKNFSNLHKRCNVCLTVLYTLQLCEDTINYICR